MNELHAGDKVILNGKLNKHHNGRLARIKEIFVRRGKGVAKVNEIEGLNPLTTKEYFVDQIKKADR